MSTLSGLQRTLREEREARERAIVGGGPKDFADYKNLVGVIQGLTLAENHLSDLVQRLEKSDE